MCCVCVFSSNSFWTSSSLDVPAGVTQEKGHTGFLIHLLSAVRASIFFARRIQPFLSLVDGEVGICVLTISFSSRWAFLRGSTIGEGGDTTISSPGRSPKQPRPGRGLHDLLHGRQACPEFIAFDQGVGQICSREGLFSCCSLPKRVQICYVPAPP